MIVHRAGRVGLALHGDQHQPQVAHPFQQPVERGLIGNRTGQLCGPARLRRHRQITEPLRPTSRIQLTRHDDLVPGGHDYCPRLKR